MTYSSCIDHLTKQVLAVVREDYYILTGDTIAAALLNAFEYWANAVIAFNPDIENPSVGVRTAKEFERCLLGIASEKHIRKRLHQLEEMGFIETFQPVAHRKSFEYRFMITKIQEAIDVLKANGQMTAGSDESQRSNDRRTNGQMTAGSDKSQRSNDRMTIYKEDLNTKKKEREEPRPLKVEAIAIEPEPEQVETCKVNEAKNDKPVESVLIAYPAQLRNPGSSKRSAAPSAVAKFDERLRTAYVPDKALEIYLQAWNQERPLCCGEAFKMDSNLRSRLLEVSKNYTPQEFSESVIYIRESDDNYYRKEKFTLSRFASPLQSHIGDCFTEHHNAMKIDTAYRDRVLGNAPSMDLGKSRPDLVGVPLAQQKYEQAVVEYSKPMSRIEQKIAERQALSRQKQA